MESNWKEFLNQDILIEGFENHTKFVVQARVSEIINDQYVCLAIYDSLLQKIKGSEWFDATVKSCPFKPLVKV